MPIIPTLEAIELAQQSQIDLLGRVCKLLDTPRPTPLSEKCTSCPTVLRYDDLKFTCDYCMGAVCPKCSGMGHEDCDDPMPKVAECPDCVAYIAQRADEERLTHEADAAADEAESAFERRYAGEHPDGDYSGRP